MYIVSEIFWKIRFLLLLANLQPGNNFFSYFKKFASPNKYLSKVAVVASSSSFAYHFEIVEMKLLYKLLNTICFNSNVTHIPLICV